MFRTKLSPVLWTLSALSLSAAAPTASAQDAGLPDASLTVPDAAPLNAEPVPDAALAEDAQPGDAAVAWEDAQITAPAPVVEVAPAPVVPVLIEPPAPEVSAAMPQPLPIAPLPPASDAPVEVTVVGTSLARTGGSAHVIRSKELERWEYDDPMAVLLNVPGVYVRGEDGMGLRPNIGLRGVDPDRSKKVTLLEDGILFGPAPYSAAAAYYFPIMTRMAQVKVIKGPAAISYGPQTVGGAVDFITRPIPSATSGAADVSAGMFGYGKAHVYAGTSTDRVGFLIEGVRLQNNGFKELPNGADTGFARNEWMVKGSYRFDATQHTRNELRLKLGYYDEVSNESYLGLTTQDFRDDPNQRYGVSALDRMRNHRTSVALTHQLDVGEHVKITTTAYRHDFQRTWRKVNNFNNASLFNVLRHPGANRNYVALLNGDGESSSQGTDSILIGPNQRDFVSEGVESRLSWERKTGVLEHRLEAGLRYHHDVINRRHSEDRFDIVDDELFPRDERTRVTAFNRGSAHAVALHVAYALTWQRLTVTPGLRSELIALRYQDKLVNQTSREFVYGLMPGVNAYYGITEQLGVLAGVYRGFGPPPPESAKTSDPESSINYEAGARYTLGNTRLEAIGFLNDYQNLTDTCTGSGGCDDTKLLNQQFDAGDARIYGVEVFAQHAFPLRSVKLPVSLSYTFSEAEFRETFETINPRWQKDIRTANGTWVPSNTVNKGDQMPYIPAHQTRASFGVDHPRASGAVNFTYVSQMREEPGTGDPKNVLHTDRQYWVDLTGQFRVYKTVALYANIFNLLNQQFIVSRRPFGARPNAPRWFHVGVKASF